MNDPLRLENQEQDSRPGAGVTRLEIADRDRPTKTATHRLCLIPMFSTRILAPPPTSAHIGSGSCAYFRGGSPTSS
jgi:hypothetical protein